MSQPDESQPFARAPGKRFHPSWFSGRGSVAREATHFADDISDLVMCLRATAVCEDQDVSAPVVRTMCDVIEGEISSLRTHLLSVCEEADREIATWKASRREN